MKQIDCSSGWTDQELVSSEEYSAQEDGRLEEDGQLRRTEHSSKIYSSRGRNTQARWTAQEDGTLKQDEQLWRMESSESGMATEFIGQKVGRLRSL